MVHDQKVKDYLARAVFNLFAEPFWERFVKITSNIKLIREVGLSLGDEN